MLNKQFCYLAGTGRTATHWVENLINRSCDKTKVATFHDGFPKRAKIKDRRNPAAFFTNYLLNLMLAHKGAQAYIECNPALLEHVALTYGVKDALSVIPAGLLAQPARGLLITRHPYTYVASIKAKGWGWQWWAYPNAGLVFREPQGFYSLPMLEQGARAWRLKNEFFYSLTQANDCILLKMEHLFDRRVTKERYTERIDRLFSHFGIVPIRDSAAWWKMRNERAAAKNKDGLKLTVAEKQIVKGICGDMMEKLEYA